MFCPSCKRKNQSYNNYCYYCGHKLKDNGKKHSFDQENMDITEELESQCLDTNSKTQSSIDISFDNTYDYFFEKDKLLYDDNLFDEGKSSDMDLSTQIPLRRYQKDKLPHKRKKVINILLSIFILMAVAALAIFAGTRRFSNRVPHTSNVGQSIAVSSSVEETTIKGKKAYRVVFNTVNGKEVSFLGEVLDVANGRAEFIVEESLLYSYNPELTEDGLYEVYVDATISAPNLSDSIERVSIILSPPYNYAPFTLLQPSSSETEFHGDSSKVSFKIIPESEVFINEQDYTSSVSIDGRFEEEFYIPSGQDELELNIRISTPGYLDNIQQIILRKSAMNVPLTINEAYPISSDEQWIKVSGTVDPGATLEADKEIFEEPDIDRETGDFTLYIKAERPGYTLCTLTAKLDNKESSIEVILDRKTSVDTYTSTAWKPNYNNLQQDEQLSNGRHFVFRGKIKDIIETGDKSIFTVSASEQSESEQIFYVEYWGSFNFGVGDPIRVFANRWGNKDGIPRFLAKYIYDR